MSTPNRYVLWFRLLNELQHKRTYPVGSGVAIERGDALILTSGYVQLATTLQGATPIWIGIANSTNTAAEASADGVVTVEVIPPLPQYNFMVPVTATDLITLAQVGVVYDLESEKAIDENDTVTLGLGFMVDAIDVSAAAVAANTFGFAIGHFEYVSAS